MNNTYFVLLNCIHGNCIFRQLHFSGVETALKLHCLSEFVPRVSYDFCGTNISAAPFYFVTILS